MILSAAAEGADAAVAVAVDAIASSSSAVPQRC